MRAKGMYLAVKMSDAGRQRSAASACSMAVRRPMREQRLSPTTAQVAALADLGCSGHGEHGTMLPGTGKPGVNGA